MWEAEGKDGLKIRVKCNILSFCNLSASEKDYFWTSRVWKWVCSLLMLHVEKGNLAVCKESYQIKPQRNQRKWQKCVVIANLALFLLLAIKFYRRAMQLVPDIEFKITYTRSPDGDGVGNS